MYTHSKKIIACIDRTDFSVRFRKKIKCYKRIGYNLLQSACLVFNSIQLHTAGSDVRLYDGPDLKLFKFVWAGALPSVAWPSGVQLQIFSGVA